MTGTRALPPCRGLMVVDAVAFSGNQSRWQPDLSAAVPELLGRAFARRDLSRIWENRRFPQSTGDGFYFGVDHTDVPYLVDPLLDALQEVLEEEDRRLRAQDRSLRLRLRAAIHLGAVPDGGDARAGVSAPTNETFRLLDSDAVRRAIKRSDPDVTLVAAIVSQRVFEDVVRAGYTSSLTPARFEPVTAEVVDKGFVAPAWLYVPKPSRAQSHPEPAVPARGGPQEPPVPQRPREATNSTQIHGNVGANISGGHINGGIHVGGDR